MSKICTYLNALFAIIAFIAAFLNIPYMNNYIVIIVSILAIVALNYIKVSIIDAEVKQNKKIEEFKGIGVYLVSYKQMGNHNVALIRRRKKENFILIEEGILEELSDKEKEAVYYHELGHLDTISAEFIFIIQGISFLFNTTGLYSIFHGRQNYLLVTVGAILFVFSEWLRRYVEYDADKKAILLGASKEDLISAICKIDEMNSKNNKIIMSGHPKTKKRINKIKYLTI